MRQKIIKKIILGFVVVLSIANASAQEDFTKYVDPTIGNVARFLVPTYPNVHLPNQMLRVFPVKQDYLSDQISGFPLQVTSHKDAILQMKVVAGNVTDASWNKKMNIDHDLEKAHPWFYSTYLIDDDITVSFTPGKKCAIYKIDFPAGLKKNMLIRGKDMISSSGKKGTFTIEEKIKYTSRGLNPVLTEVTAFVYGQIVNQNNKLLEEANIGTGHEKLLISIDQDSLTTVFLKYAISYISHQQAKVNFEKELADSGFDDLRENAKQQWGKVINQIQVKGGTEEQKRVFYTALYRSYWRMIDINEGGHYYSGFDSKVHKSDRPFYIDDSVWDTYRATHPLRTVLNPQLENDILHSYTTMYEQSGWMPTYPMITGNRMSMNGYHSSIIFIDGYRKGLKDYDMGKAFEGIHKNLTEGTFIPWRQGTPKLEIDEFFHKNGYFPGLQPGEKETIEMMDDFEKRQPVPVTLGVSYDFWALTELSKELGKTDMTEKYAEKSKNYKNIWHPELRLFMPKDEDGKWINIDPKKDGGKGFREYFDENNGWSYAWDVQHDISGLTELLGSKKAAEQRLDQLFREPLGMKKSDFFVDGSNSTGLVGQFAMGNEMSFHIPYLYNYFGAPWKTQKRTRFLLDVWFKDNIFGMPGDEDGGGMSPFVVFSSMGIYPVTPGLPFYTITSPIFEETTINLTNGKKFTIIAKGASKTVKYIQKAFINGEEISSPFITHQQIIDGGTLELVLGELPNKEWGINAKVPVMN